MLHYSIGEEDCQDMRYEIRDGGGTLNPAEQSARCAGGIKLHRQNGDGMVAGSLKWSLHPPSSSKKQGIPLRSIPCFFGAGGGTRTHTMSPSTDFESVTSANSITPAYILLSLRITDTLYHNFSQKSSTPEDFLGGFSQFLLSGLYSMRSAIPQSRASQNFSSR